MQNYAVITGASQGLGKEIAWELAAKGYAILLTSLPNENISSFADELRQKDTTVHYFETDLSIKENIIKFSEWANQFPISVLINNVGCGGSENITTANIDYIYTIIQLNITAFSLITRLLIPNLIKNSSSYILNISSMAAFSPIGYKTVYPASKKFIQYFSIGLQEELKNENVSISVAYPGPMKTNKNVSERIKKQSRFVNLGVVDLNTVAKICIRGLFKNKRTIIPGKINKLSRIILKLLPKNIKTEILSKAIKKELS
jgi:hypothetical protein